LSESGGDFYIINELPRNVRENYLILGGFGIGRRSQKGILSLEEL
jgi:hypothetical protein